MNNSSPTNLGQLIAGSGGGLAGFVQLLRELLNCRLFLGHLVRPMNTQWRDRPHRRSSSAASLLRRGQRGTGALVRQQRLLVGIHRGVELGLQRPPSLAKIADPPSEATQYCT